MVHLRIKYCEAHLICYVTVTDALFFVLPPSFGCPNSPVLDGVPNECPNHIWGTFWVEKNSWTHLQPRKMNSILSKQSTSKQSVSATASNRVLAGFQLWMHGMPKGFISYESGDEDSNGESEVEGLDNNSEDDLVGFTRIVVILE